MIISNLTGGIGNQLFQYAAGFGLAQCCNFIQKLHFTNALFCTQRNFELTNFKIDESNATKKDLANLGVPLNKYSRIIERAKKEFGLFTNKNFIYEDQLKNKNDLWHIGDNKYLIGYWQNNRYWQKYEGKLRTKIAFKEKFVKKQEENKKKICINSLPKVGVHFRRGDYVKYGDSLNLSYYKNAFQLMNAKMGKVQYICFSDDINWVKNNFENDHIIYVDFTTSGCEDLYLMSLCDYHIIANSTFSWWGSWLSQNNNKFIIAPNEWSRINDKSLVCNGMIVIK